MHTEQTCKEGAPRGGDSILENRRSVADIGGRAAGGAKCHILGGRVPSSDHPDASLSDGPSFSGAPAGGTLAGCAP